MSDDSASDLLESQYKISLFIALHLVSNFFWWRNSVRGFLGRYPVRRF